MHRYRHYGLTLAANVELAGFAPASGPDQAEDVTVLVRRSKTPPALGESWLSVSPPTAWREPTSSGSRLRLRLSGDGEWADFLLDECGTRVELTLSPQGAMTEIAEVLAGSVFSCLLAQRGWTCLHASVVRIRGRAVVLLGRKEAGKSTLALALTALGSELLSDDVAALRPEGESWALLVGRNRARVTAETAAAAGVRYADLKPIWDETRARPSKRFLEVTASHELPSTSLDAVICLADRGTSERPTLRVLSPSRLLPLLMSTRHMSHALEEAQHRRDFARLGKLVGQRPGYELLRPASLPAVPQTAAAVYRRFVHAGDSDQIEC
jgi:hypothetical protein